MRLLAGVGLLLAAAACQGATGAGSLHARKVTLEREVEGLRGIVARLERGEPGLPPGDVVIALEDRLLRDLLAAEMPVEADVDRFHVRLEKAEVSFRGSPLVTLEGHVRLAERSDLEGEVRLLGAIDRIRIDPESGTLRAAIAIDHVDLMRVGGLEGIVSGDSLDRLGRSLRSKLAGRLPALTIPVRVRQRIDLAAVTTGPVRIDGASMRLEVTVSQVLAVGGTLWVAVHVEAGDFVKAGAGPTRGAAGSPSASVGRP